MSTLKGMEKIVTYIKDSYNNTPMFISEKRISLIELLDVVSKVLK